MKKRLLITSIVMMLVVAVALSTATYAWFTSNTRVKADSVLLTASTMAGDAILISHNKNNTDLSNAIVFAPNDTLRLYPATPNADDALTAVAPGKFINLQIDGNNQAKQQTITSPTASYYTDTFYVYNKGFSAVALAPTVTIYFNASNGASYDAAKSVRIAVVESVGSQIATSNSTGDSYTTKVLKKIYQYNGAVEPEALETAVVNYIPAPTTFDENATYYTDRNGTEYDGDEFTAESYATYIASNDLFVPASISATHKNVMVAGATGNYGAETEDGTPSATSVYTQDDITFTETAYADIAAPLSNYYVANEYTVIVWLEGWDTECTNAMSAGLFRIDISFVKA